MGFPKIGGRGGEFCGLSSYEGLSDFGVYAGETTMSYGLKTP